MIGEVFPEGASILYFTGAPNDQQYIDRKQGLEDALKGSNITILGEYNVENAKDLGMSTADDCLLFDPYKGHLRMADCTKLCS